MNIKKLIVGIISISVIINPSFVLAEELTVSGNGDSSTSTVNIQTNQNTQIEQNNNANINNNVTVSANTGNNTATDNSGGNTTIISGDANATVNIVNTGVNQSTLDNSCCINNNLTANISGNGSNSNNSIAYSSNNNTNVSVNNNANINNSIQGWANTGNNIANDNTGGSVFISTGDIIIKDNIKNNNINISAVEAPQSNGGSAYIKIAGNGDDSENAIVLNDDHSINIEVNNKANINNSSDWDLNTGNNSANRNAGGDVSIETGDIILATNIENTNINGSIVDVDCCSEKHGPTPDGTPTPSSPSTNNNNTASSGGNGANGSSTNGPTSQMVLPVTGSPSLIILATICGIMFFFGWYLRLRSGRSPNIAR